MSEMPRSQSISHPDLLTLTDAEIADYNIRLLANCSLYGLSHEEADSNGDGLTARIASACALNDVIKRRLRPGRTR